MPEREISIHHNGEVGRNLEAILSPWSSVPKKELPEIMKGVSVPVIELARRAGVSPQRALREAPSRIELNGQGFRVVRGSGRSPLDFRVVGRNTPKLTAEQSPRVSNSEAWAQPPRPPRQTH